MSNYIDDLSISKLIEQHQELLITLLSDIQHSCKILKIIVMSLIQKLSEDIKGSISVKNNKYSNTKLFLLLITKVVIGQIRNFGNNRFGAL